jgi:hypothetical protein
MIGLASFIALFSAWRTTKDPSTGKRSMMGKFTIFAIGLSCLIGLTSKAIENQINRNKTEEQRKRADTLVVKLENIIKGVTNSSNKLDTLKNETQNIVDSLTKLNTASNLTLTSLENTEQSLYLTNEQQRLLLSLQGESNYQTLRNQYTLYPLSIEIMVEYPLSQNEVLKELNDTLIKAHQKLMWDRYRIDEEIKPGTVSTFYSDWMSKPLILSPKYRMVYKDISTLNFYIAFNKEFKNISLNIYGSNYDLTLAYYDSNYANNFQEGSNVRNEILKSKLETTFNIRYYESIVCIYNIFTPVKIADNGKISSLLDLINSQLIVQIEEGNLQGVKLSYIKLNTGNTINRPAHIGFGSIESDRIPFGQRSFVRYTKNISPKELGLGDLAKIFNELLKVKKVPN